MEKVKAEVKLVLGAENDLKKVTYVPNNIDDTMEYSWLLIKEMRLHQRITLRKKINKLQSELKECLEAEINMKKTISQTSQAKTREKSTE